MKAYRSSRRAVTIVETTMVISVVLLFVFGIFEYGRYVMCLQVVENAAREGARFAIAHTNDKTTTDITNYTTQKLAGIQGQLANFNMSLSAIVLKPQDTTQAAGDPLPSWTDAGPTDGIVLEITGNFKPVLPTFLSLPTTIPVKARCVMYSEGN